MRSVSGEQLITGEKQRHDNINRGVSVGAAFGNRKWSDVLSDWEASHKGVGTQEFLKRMHLDAIISPQQWQQMIASPPKLVTSGALAYHMVGLMMRDGLYTTKHPHMSTINTQRGLNGRIERVLTYAERRGVVILAPTKDQLQALRDAVAQDVYDKLHKHHDKSTMGESGGVQVSDEFVNHPFTKRLLAHMKHTYPELEEQAFLVHLQDSVKQSPDLAKDVVTQTFTSQPLEAIEAWVEFARNSGSIEHSGDMLRFYRHCSGKYQTDIKNPGNKERNRYAGNREQLGLDSPAGVVMALNRYGLAASDRVAVLKVAYPALSSEWLNKQPKEKQAGLLSRAIRSALGLTFPVIDAAKLDIKKSIAGVESVKAILTDFELRHQALDSDNMKALCDFYVSEAQRQKLNLITSDMLKILQAHTKDVVRFDAGLDDEALEAMPFNKQGGALLKAIRSKAGLSGTQTSGGLYRRQKYQRSESGADPITSDKLDIYVQRIREALEAKHEQWFTPELEAKLREKAALFYKPALECVKLPDGLALPETERDPAGFNERIKNAAYPFAEALAYMGIPESAAKAVVGVSYFPNLDYQKGLTGKNRQAFVQLFHTLNEMLPEAQRIDMQAFVAAVEHAHPVKFERLAMTGGSAALGSVSKSTKSVSWNAESARPKTGRFVA
jgi:hypothetical protein